MPRSLKLNVKITFSELAIARVNRGDSLEQAGIGLDSIVAKSLRQAPPSEVPLMAWPLVCGYAVSERTRAMSFQNGLLHVEVADVGWKSELQALAPRYLAAINRYAPDMVQRIEFIVSGAESAKQLR
jgi:hypothetical protein